MSTKDDIYSLAAGNRGFLCLASFSFRAAHLFSAIRGNLPPGASNSRSVTEIHAALKIKTSL